MTEECRRKNTENRIQITRDNRKRITADIRKIIVKKACAMNSVLCVLFLVAACATTEPARKSGSETGQMGPEKKQTNQTQSQKSDVLVKNSELSSADFKPVSEELSPLKTRIISISVKGSPLRDVLYVIAESTGLNLVMEKGVNPDIPVTITLRNVSAEDALRTIFESVDYFYSVKENMLIVKAMETRIFEFNQPSVVQDYSVEVGGDILGGTTTGSTSGATTTSGTTGTTGTTGVKGAVAQKIQADRDSFRLWDSMEKAIGNLLGISGGAVLTPQASTEKTQMQPSYSINRMTGTIAVTATKKDLQRVADYLTTIKRILSRQVIIEARVVEVQLSEGLKYGVDWSALDLSNLGQITVGTTNFSSVVSSNSPSFQVGVSKWDFTGLLQALQSQGDTRVLSNPRVNIMNGQTALLSVGRNVNFISRVDTTTAAATSTSSATTTFTVQTSSILSGIIIGIVPHISENGEVSMAVTPIVSDLVKLDDKTFGSGANTIQISLPTVDLRELSTTVKVRDGQMVVIGGLIQTRDKLQDNQVPFLGNIPILGHLFKSREKSNERTELIIMLKPMVVTQ